MICAALTLAAMALSAWCAGALAYGLTGSDDVASLVALIAAAVAGWVMATLRRWSIECADPLDVESEAYWSDSE